MMKEIHEPCEIALRAVAGAYLTGQITRSQLSLFTSFLDFNFMDDGAENCDVRVLYNLIHGESSDVDMGFISEPEFRQAIRNATGYGISFVNPTPVREVVCT